MSGKDNIGVCVGGAHAGRFTYMAPGDKEVDLTLDGVTESYYNTGLRAEDGRAVLLPKTVESGTPVLDFLLYEYQQTTAANRAAHRALAGRTN
jgi:hypothetical protein